MNPTDDTPDTATGDTHDYHEFSAPMTPDPTDQPTFADTYARAHHAARAVLERIGIADTTHLVGQLDDRDADRLVSTVLGAALLELERPWREELEAARYAAAIYRDQASTLTNQRDRAREQRDGVQNAADNYHEQLLWHRRNAERRRNLIDVVHQLLGEVETNPDLDVINGIVDEARENLREELDR